jgi:DNA mismatch endonuclease, patch repair protein
MDAVSPETRSYMMSRVRGDMPTGPERRVGSMLWRNGARDYRKNCRLHPGKPDFCFHRIKTAVFVHGCFWHGHGCRVGRPPKSNAGYWKAKISANRRRDRRVLSALGRMGWRTAVVWECQLDNVKR